MKTENNDCVVGIKDVLKANKMVIRFSPVMLRFGDVLMGILFLSIVFYFTTT